VLRHTAGDYELILVDNGSNDSIPELFENFKSRPEPARVHVIRNESNRGFAAGVNQGLAAAQGEFLVLLNNDAVVTPGWLEGLIARSLTDWPKIGMVGPVSNYATSPQQVDPGYRNLDGLDTFCPAAPSAIRGASAGSSPGSPASAY